MTTPWRPHPDGLHLVFREPADLEPLAFYSTHFPVDPDEQMLTKHCISRPVSRSDQDRNAKTTVVRMRVKNLKVYAFCITGAEMGCGSRGIILCRFDGLVVSIRACGLSDMSSNLSPCSVFRYTVGM